MKTRSTARPDRHSSRHKFSRRLAAYTAAAGAGAVSGAAEAAPLIFTPPGGPQTLSAGAFSFAVDINGDAQSDYNFFLIDNTQYGALGFDYQVEHANLFLDIPSNGVFIDGASYLTRVFAAGEVVGPTGDSADVIGPLGSFYGLRGFIGVVFDIPGGSPHYGYLDIEIPADRNTLTLYGGGWESEPNTPIQIPVPEPAGLALLASGSAGVAAWRRRSGKV